jgi:nitrogen fixation/metabolism regulation signal transduction histidine kinase
MQMDTILILFCVLVIVFLAIVAVIYLTRPSYFINEDEASPDIDKWLAFIFGLVIAVMTVIVVAIIWLKCCFTNATLSFSLIDILAFNLTKSKCPRV